MSLLLFCKKGHHSVQASAERLDHLGLVAGVIKEVGLVELIDERIGTDPRENISTGESIAGMIINGLGFSSKPLSLTPQFFQNKAVSTLFREDVQADDFNANKLSRSLDKVHQYGVESLFAELSAKVCSKEKVQTDYRSLDTTSISLTGEYDVDTDENTIEIKHGHSKDHRPDLKQLVHELVVSQDGGIPLMMKSWDGNASDNTIFRERTKFLVDGLQGSDWSGYLIADSKLYHAKNAVHLKLLHFITRIPASIHEEGKTIKKALEQNIWNFLDEKNKYYSYKLTHYDIEQRWIVVHSKSAESRAIKRAEKLVKREMEKIVKFQKKINNSHFECENDAKAALIEWSKSLIYYEINDIKIKKMAHFSKKGSRKKEVEPDYHTINLEFSFSLNEEKKAEVIAQDSCYVVGTNAQEEALTDIQVVEAYKKQNSSIENMAFRFLKDPIFFVSSLFIKKPARIEALLFVMTLSLLIYSIAQRKLRQALQLSNEVIPNQIKQPTQRPTLRWVFQLLEGIDIIRVIIEGKMHKIISGLNELSKKILLLFGESVCAIYELTV
jgi:transposase